MTFLNAGKDKSYLKLHLIVFLWGFTALSAAFMQMDSLSITFWRTLLSAGGFGLILMVGYFFADKVHTKNMVTPGKLLQFWLWDRYALLAGFLLGFHWITFFYSVKTVGVSLTLLCLSTVCVWVAIVEPVLGLKRFGFVDFIVAFTVILGFFFVFGFSSDKVDLAITVPLVSAMFSALFSLASKKAMVQSALPVFVGYIQMMGAFAVVCFSVVGLFGMHWFGLVKLPLDQIQFLPVGEDLFWLMILSMVCTVFAYYLLFKLLETLSAYSVCLACNLEPVYGIVLSFLLLGEVYLMDQNFFGGSAIILSAVFLYPIVERRQRR